MTLHYSDDEFLFMGPTIDSKIKPLDVGTPMLQIKYGVKVVEPISSAK
jgi:hypothetical protein